MRAVSPLLFSIFTATSGWFNKARTTLRWPCMLAPMRAVSPLFSWIFTSTPSCLSKARTTLMESLQLATMRGVLPFSPWCLKLTFAPLRNMLRTSWILPAEACSCSLDPWDVKICRKFMAIVDRNSMLTTPNSKTVLASLRWRSDDMLVCQVRCGSSPTLSAPPMARHTCGRCSGRFRTYIVCFHTTTGSALPGQFWNRFSHCVCCIYA